MRPHEVNDTETGVMGWYLDDTSICDEIIQYHKDMTEMGVAQRGISYNSEVNNKFKDSWDVALLNKTLHNKYVSILAEVHGRYSSMNEYAMAEGAVTMLETINIQRYIPPEGGFHSWHSERNSEVEHSFHRAFTYMTYLNDVTDCGETEWWYQKFKIEPEKGLTLIWPAYWWWTHRGIASPTQEKYIVTGWLHHRTPRMRSSNLANIYNNFYGEKRENSQEAIDSLPNNVKDFIQDLGLNTKSGNKSLPKNIPADMIDNIDNLTPDQYEEIFGEKMKKDSKVVEKNINFNKIEIPITIRDDKV
jgi:hypothetical protein